MDRLAASAASSAFSAVAKDLGEAIAQAQKQIGELQGELSSAKEVIIRQGRELETTRADVKALRELYDRQTGIISTMRSDFASSYSKQTQRDQITALQQSAALTEEAIQRHARQIQDWMAEVEARLPSREDNGGRAGLGRRPSFEEALRVTTHAGKVVQAGLQVAEDGQNPARQIQEPLAPAGPSAASAPSAAPVGAAAGEVANAGAAPDAPLEESGGGQAETAAAPTPTVAAAQEKSPSAHAEGSAIPSLQDAFAVDMSNVRAVWASSEWGSRCKENLLQAEGFWLLGEGDSSGSVIFDLGRPSSVRCMGVSNEGSLAGPARWPQEAIVHWRPDEASAWKVLGSASLSAPDFTKHRDKGHMEQVDLQEAPVVARQLKLEVRNEEALYFPEDALTRLDEDGAIAIGRVWFG